MSPVVHFFLDDAIAITRHMGNINIMPFPCNLQYLYLI